MNVTVKNINRFLLLKLPAAFICGVRLQKIDNESAVTKVRHRWINQNPFNSLYFAVQSMAAELSTGALVIKKIKESEKQVSMLITNHSGAFTKKAKGKIEFVCKDGFKIDEFLTKTIETGEGESFIMTSVGIDEKGEEVSKYTFEWSLKLKS